MYRILTFCAVLLSVGVFGQSKSSDTDTDSIPSLNVFIPNAFSPNADGYNDFWRPVIEGRNIETYDLLITNRNGAEVFRTEDPREGWNGAMKGGGYATTSSIYLYYLNLRTEGDPENRVFRGHITVVR